MLKHYIETGETPRGKKKEGRHNITVGNNIKETDRSVGSLKNITEGSLEKSIITVKKDYKTKHPTQKPVELMRRLIQLVSDEGDVILDPFMGSGSTGLACAEIDREFIGIEIDEEYFNLAKSRLNNQLKDA